MSGYTKLFNSILASTVWSEPNEVRIVWITLLAMADKNGTVEGSIPGLAVFARLTLEATQHALERLSAPDEFSRSKEHEGRRIEAVSGGWRLINHDKYRQKLSADERREYLRVKQQEQRNKRKASTVVNNVSDKSTESTHTAPAPAPTPAPEAATEATEVTSKALAVIEPPVVTPTSRRFAAFWEKYPRKSGRSGAEKLWKKIRPDSPLITQMESALEHQRQTEQWQKNDGQYIPSLTTWLKDARWQDEVKPMNGLAHLDERTRQNIAAAERFANRKSAQ